VTLFYVVIQFTMSKKQKPTLRVVFTDVKRAMTGCEVTRCVEVVTSVLLRVTFRPNMKR